MKKALYPTIIIIGLLIVFVPSLERGENLNISRNNILAMVSQSSCSACSFNTHVVTIAVSPNPVLVNQTVSIKTSIIPECNSPSAYCEWRWSGAVTRVTTNKPTGEWTTSFSTIGTKEIKVEVYVEDATVCSGSWIKVASGSSSFNVYASTPTPTPTPSPTKTPTPTPTPSPTKTPTPTPTPSPTKTPTPTPTPTKTPTPTPTPTPTLTPTPTCPSVPHQTKINFSANPALKKTDVVISTDNIPECNSSSASCEWRWSGTVNAINNKKLNGAWTTQFSDTGTKEIKVEVYVKDETICGDSWIKVAYASANLEIVSGGVTPTPTPTPTDTPTPTPTITPTPTPTPTPYHGGGGGGYWLGGTTPTPTVLGTSTCSFVHFESALAETTCWINGRIGGSCSLNSSDGFNVRLAILANSYPEDIRINISAHQLNNLIDPNVQVGNYKFVGSKIIHIAAEDENCHAIDLENLAVLTINYSDGDIKGFNENSLSISYAPFAPVNWNLLTTYRNISLNSVSAYTAQFGYFGVMGLVEKKVLGVSTVAKSTPSPNFIAWFDPVCITNEPQNLNNFYTLAALIDRIRNIRIPWYWISLLFNILIILWLLWLYAGKKLLAKYHTAAIAEKGTADSDLAVIFPSADNNSDKQQNYTSISSNKDSHPINSPVINLPGTQSSEIQPIVYLTKENSPSNNPDSQQENQQQKANVLDDEEILKRLKTKLNPLL